MSMVISQPTEFEKRLEEIINYHSQENKSNTPDFILASYIMHCLENWNTTVMAREIWYGRDGEFDASITPSQD